MRHRPYSLSAPGRPSPDRAHPRKNEGARNAKGPNGPTGLDASRHRGLSKSSAPPSPFGFGAASRKSTKPMASRARCFLGLLRVVPGERPVSPHTQLQALKTLHPWARHLGRRSSDRTRDLPAVRKPMRAAARHDNAAWTAGRVFASHLQRPRPATASRLSIWSADQTPLGRMRRDEMRLYTLGILSRASSNKFRPPYPSP
jgi:hypothetical protein